MITHSDVTMLSRAALSARDMALVLLADSVNLSPEAIESLRKAVRELGDTGRRLEITADEEENR